jgi:trigger factor
MDVLVAESGPCRRTLTIKLAADEIRAKLDEVYKAASEQVQIKGFRPGKVPRKVLEQRFGDDIQKQAKERLIGDTCNNALRQHELAVVGQPKIEGFDGTEPLDPSKPLEFQLLVDVRPEFELGDVTGIEIEGNDPAVTDEDVQNALKDLANQKRTLDTVDEPVQDGDFVKCDLVFKNEAGEVVGEREGQQLNTQIPLAGTDPQLFAEKLREQEKGAKIEIELTFPDSFEKEEVRGQQGMVEMTVQEVMRVQPAKIDDELAKGFNFESLQALEEKLREQIGVEKERNEKNRREEAILDKILDKHAFDLPESMVEQECEHLLQDLARRMKEGGADEQQIEGKLAEERPNAMTLAQKRVRVFFVMDAIAQGREAVRHRERRRTGDPADRRGLQRRAGPGPRAVRAAPADRAAPALHPGAQGAGIPHLEGQDHR